METSIIIRTKNEQKWIGAVLQKLSEQTYQDFEIIIVDSGSTDDTLKIAQQYPIKLIQIKPEEFSYPFALNVGCKEASAAKYFVFLSAHSLPISKTWLADGIENFTDDTVLGVYGGVLALPDASFWEKLIFSKFRAKLSMFFRRRLKINKSAIGVMGFTNAIIRKDLWQRHSIDERYGMGGEDGAWADYWFQKGYFAIKDIKFSVFHSHGLGIEALIRQYMHWRSVANPKDFKALEYRKK